MPKRPAKKILLPIGEVVQMAKGEGVPIHPTSLSEMVRKGQIPGAKPGKRGGRGGGSKHMIPKGQAEKIVGNLKRRKELLETHVTVDQIIKQARETSVDVPGQKQKRRLEVNRQFIGSLIRRRIVKGAIKDSTSTHKIVRWLIPKDQIDEIMFRILQVNAPRISGHLTIQGVVGDARKQDVEIHPTTINQMLHHKKYGEKYREILGVAQFLGEGRRPANWLISPEGSRRIIASAKVKKPAFMRAMADMPVKEVEKLANRIVKARGKGSIYTVAEAAGKLGVGVGTLHNMEGIDYKTRQMGGQKYVTGEDVETLRGVIEQRRREIAEHWANIRAAGVARAKARARARSLPKTWTMERLLSEISARGIHLSEEYITEWVDEGKMGGWGERRADGYYFHPDAVIRAMELVYGE